MLTLIDMTSERLARHGEGLLEHPYLSQPFTQMDKSIETAALLWSKMAFWVSAKVDLEAQGRDSTFTFCHTLLKKAILHYKIEFVPFVSSTTVLQSKSFKTLFWRKNKKRERN